MYKLDAKKSNEEILSNIKMFEFLVRIEGKPENYVRERYSKFSGFYNKKGKLMKSLKDKIIKDFEDDLNFQKVQEIIKEKDNFYYIELEMKFSLPIPKGDSKKTKERKLLGILKPCQRPDIDNYAKYIMDSLHGAFYDDDCRIIKETSEKKFDEAGSSEIRVKFYFYEEV